MSNKLFLGGIVTALVIVSAVSYYWPSLSAPTNPPPVTRTSSCVKPPGYFLIIADLQGFNNSVTHIQNSPNEPWPVIKVHKGDRVNILVCNMDDYSAHGFAVQHYLEAGVALMPHESFRFSFVADQVGSFTMYCNIFCPVHPYMLNGQLIVID